MKVETTAAEMWHALDSASPAAAVYIESIVANIRNAATAYSRAYYLIVLLGLFFWLVLRGGIHEISFASVGVRDIAALRWIIPAAMGAAYYHATSAFALELHLLAVLDEYYRIHAPAIGDHKLAVLSYPVSFFNLERAHTKIFGSAVSLGASAFVGLAVLIMPAALIGIVIYANVMEPATRLSGALQLVFFGLTVVFLLRTLVFLAEAVRNKVL